MSLGNYSLKKYCEEVNRNAYCGWSYGGSGTISLVLQGRGRVTLDFGNVVEALKNLTGGSHVTLHMIRAHSGHKMGTDTKIAVAVPETESKVHTVDFDDGDELLLTEDAAMMVPPPPPPAPRPAPPAPHSPRVLAQVVNSIKFQCTDAPLCPAACGACKQDLRGGVTGGSNHRGVCQQFCSKDNYCGLGSTHVMGLDCSGCAQLTDCSLLGPASPSYRMQCKAGGGWGLPCACFYTV